MPVLLLVGAHLCANRPPILIFSSSAQMNFTNDTKTDSLAKLSNSTSGSQLKPVLNQKLRHYDSSRRFATTSFFSLLIFIQISSK